MNRVLTLLDKIEELAKQKKELSPIEIDLMLDYTRILYADLLEVRGRVSFNNNIPTPKITPQGTEKTCDIQENLQIETGDSDVIKNEQTQKAGNIIVEQEEVKAPTQTKDIRTIIGINDTYLFIEELFNKNKAEYDNTLKKLNTCTVLHEAINWTKTELEPQYNWDKESSTVQSFYDVLNNFFSDK